MQVESKGEKLAGKTGFSKKSPIFRKAPKRILKSEISAQQEASQWRDKFSYSKEKLTKIFIQYPP